MAFEHLSHERYVYAYSGEINRDDIDPVNGSHDVLKDWGYPDDSDLLQEVESLVFGAFRDMLEHVGEVINEPADPVGKSVSPDQMEALGVLATSLGSEYTVSQIEARLYGS